MNVLGLLASFSLIAAPANIVNFDRGPLGKMPPGWTAAMTNRGAAPQWEIRKDPSAPTQPYVFAQISTDPNRDRLPLAIFDSVSLRDADISVRLKAVSGREDQGGGLVFRYLDEKNYYVVRADALHDDVALYKIENGRCSPIVPRGQPPSQVGVKRDFLPNTWHILKVSVRGNRFQVYVNHRRILQVEDSTYRGPGKVGLSTKADSVTYFDDFRVYPK
ncbi:MAG TPA: hypothetical protein VG096_01865 [Bryobacteraceae bacterium]|jgi:hypothetical protein|nr:hypothetical protein [Bryobacteraceae bacterium]